MTHSSASWGRALQKAAQFSSPCFSRGTFKEQRKHPPSPQAASFGNSQLPAAHSWLPFGQFCFPPHKTLLNEKRNKRRFHLYLPNKGGNAVSLTAEQKKINLLQGNRGKRSLCYLPAGRIPRGTNGGEAPPYKYQPLADYLYLYPPWQSPSLFETCLWPRPRLCPPLRPPLPRSRRRRRAAPKPAGPSATELITEAVATCKERKGLPRSRRPRQRQRALRSRRPPRPRAPKRWLRLPSPKRRHRRALPSRRGQGPGGDTVRGKATFADKPNSAFKSHPRYQKEKELKRQFKSRLVHDDPLPPAYVTFRSAPIQTHTL